MTDTPDERNDDGRGSTPEPSSDRSAAREGEWELAVQRPYEPDSPGDLTETIVAAVADAEGVSPRDVKCPPLYEVVDTAALESAFFGREAHTSEARPQTEFEYRGYRVVVRSDGWILVHERRDR